MPLSFCRSDGLSAGKMSPRVAFVPLRFVGRKGGEEAQKNAAPSEAVCVGRGQSEDYRPP